MTNQATPHELITTAEALASACARWQDVPWLAFDTEFLREDTYHPILCLVQVGDGARHVCIDTLALDAAGLAPLWALLRRPGCIKVLHSASQDMEIFVKEAAAAVAPLFDTQIAASLLGEGDQLGYAALVERRFGVVLDKSLTRTNWSRRPLSEAELAYAAEDVRWLAALYPRLREELVARGRLGWLEEDCAKLADPARYANPPEQAWRRLKGLGRLRPRAQAVAVALAVWREQQAQARDRPRKWILDDESLYRLAERLPQQRVQLAELGLPLKTIDRHGADLLALIQEAPAVEATGAADLEALDAAQKESLRRVQERLRAIADSLGLSASFLAPRADLEALVRHGAAARTGVLEGWRRSAAGEALLAVL